jgi:hypothetical protein
MKHGLRGRGWRSLGDSELPPHARLHQALAAADPGAAFDQLRKTYPPRHEFHRYRVIGIPEQKSDLKLRLQGLGFHVG